MKIEDCPIVNSFIHRVFDKSARAVKRRRDSFTGRNGFFFMEEKRKCHGTSGKLIFG